MPEDGPQHSGGMTGSLKAARAAVVLVVFVVAVAVLVAVGTRSSPTSSTSAQTTSTTVASGGGSTTTTAAAGGAAATTTPTTAGHRSGHGTTTTTTSTTVPHASVSVVVANATNTNGLAAHYSNVIGAGGWKMGTPIDASTTESTSAVYYAAGQQAAANAIASAIGVKPAQVLPLTTSTPVNGVTGTDVVVVIGSDLASAAGS